uniref:Uncharacterized protein n=1 Tax=Nelumbo nucifera TaxID=4432 RepID=A0A822Y9K7_NELNU|nr:TPA_asm: hypothetical protein HUJ06_030252 [Nelumbo nucifera]
MHSQQSIVPNKIILEKQPYQTPSYEVGSLLAV